MRSWLLLAALLSGCLPAAWCDEPPARAKVQLCAVLDNRIVGPRSADRPLPLLQGDPEHGGLRAACSVAWSTLSPNSRPLPVTGCYQNSVLRIANDAACGRATGPLWVSSRWVITAAELSPVAAEGAHCQKMETTAYAGTRDFPPACVPDKPDPKTASDPSSTPRSPPAERTQTPK